MKQHVDKFGPEAQIIFQLFLDGPARWDENEEVLNQLRAGLSADQQNELNLYLKEELDRNQEAIVYGYSRSLADKLGLTEEERHHLFDYLTDHPEEVPSGWRCENPSFSAGRDGLYLPDENHNFVTLNYVDGEVLGPKSEVRKITKKLARRLSLDEAQRAAFKSILFNNVKARFEYAMQRRSEFPAAPQENDKSVKRKTAKMSFPVSEECPVYWDRNEAVLAELEKQLSADQQQKLKGYLNELKQREMENDAYVRSQTLSTRLGLNEADRQTLNKFFVEFPEARKKEILKGLDPELHDLLEADTDLNLHL